MAGASPAEISSWLFALGMSLAITCVAFSLFYKMPILTGWSTPGAALLVTSISGLSMPEAIGVFMFAALLTIIVGVTGIFEKIICHIPKALTSAMLAGILLHFGMSLFSAMQQQVALVATMLITYLIGKRFFSRYVIIAVLLVGIVSAFAQNLFQLNQLHLSFSTPIFTMPVFSLSALISVGIPLFIVTMTSQNLPGIAVLESSGYNPSISPLISWTGFATFIFAPFGCYSISLAALTAAICTNQEADPDPKNRYKSTIFAGLCWLCIAIFGGTVVSLFFAFPKEFVLAIAGIALLSSIGSSLNVALAEEKQREASIITILVAASGFSLFGIGSAFWSLIAGFGASFLLTWQRAPKQIIPISTEVPGN